MRFINIELKTQNGLYGKLCRSQYKDNLTNWVETILDLVRPRVVLQEDFEQHNPDDADMLNSESFQTLFDTAKKYAMTFNGDRLAVTPVNFVLIEDKVYLQVKSNNHEALKLLTENKFKAVVRMNYPEYTEKWITSGDITKDIDRDTLNYNIASVVPLVFILEKQ